MDRHNGASHQAIHSAAQAILSGDQDLVIAGGVDTLPVSPPVLDLPGHWLADPQPGFHAQQMAEKWNLTRAALDGYVLASMERHLRADEQGYLKGQVVVLNPANGYALSSDQPLPHVWTEESLASLAPLFKPGGVITSAHLSPPAAGAAAVLLASPRAVGRLNLTPLALLAARGSRRRFFDGPGRRHSGHRPGSETCRPDPGRPGSYPDRRNFGQLGPGLDRALATG